MSSRVGSSCERGAAAVCTLGLRAPWLTAVHGQLSGKLRCEGCSASKQGPQRGAPDAGEVDAADDAKQVAGRAQVGLAVARALRSDGAISGRTAPSKHATTRLLDSGEGNLCCQQE